MRPILVADLAVNECYEFRPETPLDIPITAFAGRTDPVAGPELVEPWRSQTGAGFRLHVLDGGHFAVFDRATSVHAEIARVLRNEAAPAVATSAIVHMRQSET
ncbi:thioesterase II family protein [Amycolatopsis sp. MtRt-6]|uniref:thioesterase II family protein n=1 Tax=Amycolatopsis sp. MtRt-6 TaxID=2792782 RepID=UPI002413CF98|nr:hypothetical protein [Amycolatopsis sp. MtRt-6]